LVIPSILTDVPCDKQGVARYPYHRDPYH
jgi:hypothetical protein